MGRQFFLDGRFKADGGIGFVHPCHASWAQPDSTEERLEALVVAGVWSLRDFACVLQFVSEDFDELVVASFRPDDNAEVPVLSTRSTVARICLTYRPQGSDKSGRWTAAGPRASS